ncbi:MAG: hypothetical protein IT203_03905 [Fimbriimonadaceae bacterium]|nr:hypothetical protein [Fimbriimonadaceae bacterium]
MASAPGEILGQPSWRIESDRVEAFVTQSGAHLGPVTFDLGDRKVQPFHIAPWHSEKLEKGTPKILEALRGDFFCMPFGGNAIAYGDEVHPLHGETANSEWTLVSPGTFELRTLVRPTLVRREVGVRSGETVVYSRTSVIGGSGPMCIGNHAMLAFPSEGLVSCSPFLFGQVFPGEFEVPAKGGYSCLSSGERFQRLEIVPMANGSVADLSRYPAREGYEDLVMLIGDESLPFAWNAVVFPAKGYAWFCLRNPRVLRHTLLWHSNGGRHYPPWNGRHRGVLGIEDVTAYFHYGLAESVSPNALSDEGVVTSIDLDPSNPLVASTIMGVIPVGPDAEHVEEITAEDGGVQIVLRSGKSEFASLDLAFLG